MKCTRDLRFKKIVKIMKKIKLFIDRFNFTLFENVGFLPLTSSTCMAKDYNVFWRLILQNIAKCVQSFIGVQIDHLTNQLNDCGQFRYLNCFM